MLWLSIRKVLILFTVLVMMGMMASTAQGESSLSGVWQFTLTGTYNGSDPEETLNRTVFSIALQEVGSYLFGTIQQEYLLGVREGDKVSFRILSQSGQAGNNQNIGIQGEMHLQLVHQKHMKGDGIRLQPTLDSGALEAFDVEAVRVGPLESGTGVKGIVSWCELLQVNTILGFFLGESPVKPCDVCTITWDGGGFYAFGQVCPGSALKPILQATVYVPVEWASCQTRPYNFNIVASDRLWSVDKLKDALEAKELQWLGINDVAKMATELTEFVRQYGDFAISLGHSFNTGNSSLYISLPTRSDAACSAVQNTSFFQAIKNIFPAEVFCGQNIHDFWNLRRSAVPGEKCGSHWWCPCPTICPIANPLDSVLHSNGCNTGVLYLYLFGTIKVKFD